MPDLCGGHLEETSCILDLIPLVVDLIPSAKVPTPRRRRRRQGGGRLHRERHRSEARRGERKDLICVLYLEALSSEP